MRNQDQQNRNYRDQNSCAHAWAHQLSNRGQSSNFFFDGATIYSYGRHFPIATLDGDRVFFNCMSYSVSTSAHKRIVRSAISHKTLIHVAHLPVDDLRINVHSSFVQRNLRFWMEDITSELKSYQANPKLKTLIKSIEEQCYLLKSLIGTFYNEAPEEFSTILDNPILKEAEQIILEQRRIKEIRLQNRKHTQLSSFEKSLLKWENGTIPLLKTPHPIDANLSYLRLSSDEESVETSKGIRVPLETARQLWMYICQHINLTGIKSDFRILNFQVQEISPEFLKAGCHTIPMAEVDKIAKQLKWI